MKNLKYKLVTSDLDATIVSHSQKESPKNKVAIQKVRNMGVNFVISSGRNQFSIKPFEEKYGLNEKGCYGIAFNGGVVYEADTGKILRDIRLDKNVALDIIKELKTMTVATWVFVGNDLYLTEFTEWAQRYSHTIDKYIEIEDLAKIEGEISKVIVSDERHILEGVQSHFNKKDSPFYTTVFSAENLLEFVPPTVNKGEGLKFLANHLGIDLSETIAIGDNFNDIEMIRMAGIGVAVANGRKEVKVIADYVTENPCEDGAVAEALSKFIINDLK